MGVSQSCSPDGSGIREHSGTLLVALIRKRLPMLLTVSTSGTDYPLGDPGTEVMECQVLICVLRPGTTHA